MDDQNFQGDRPPAGGEPTSAEGEGHVPGDAPVVDGRDKPIKDDEGQDGLGSKSGGLGGPDDPDAQVGGLGGGSTSGPTKGTESPEGGGSATGPTPSGTPQEGGVNPDPDTATGSTESGPNPAEDD